MATKKSWVGPGKVLSPPMARFLPKKKKSPATKTPGIIIIKIHPPDEVMILRALNHLFNKLAVADINGKLILLLEEGFIAK